MWRRNVINYMRHVREQTVNVGTVSRDDRWVVTVGGDTDIGETKACEVETVQADQLTNSLAVHSKVVTG